MNPWELIDTARTPEGTYVTLCRRGNEYMIHADGKDLMSSRMHGSEEALARLGCERARTLEAPRVLVGGLGMGFTLRAALDVLPPGATVVVAELLAAVVAWVDGPLGPLAGKPLDDPRVRIEVRDVTASLREGAGGFDAVLLDVDNGPRAFVLNSNAGLYDNGGVAAARDALAPGGVLAVWSAWDDRTFEHRLRHVGFTARTTRVRGRLEKGGPFHCIFVGEKD
jgi:spermidine synthase